MHAVADVHDTPDRELEVAPLALGVGWIAQLLPFQSSASVAPPPPPTAMHSLAEMHETSLSPLEPDVGVDWIAQLVPSQCSATAAVLKLVSVADPTAMHSLAEVHETPLSPLP